MMDDPAASPLEEFHRRLDAAREERRPPTPTRPVEHRPPLIGAEGIEVTGNVVSVTGGGRRVAEVEEGGLALVAVNINGAIGILRTGGRFELV